MGPHCEEIIVYQSGWVCCQIAPPDLLARLAAEGDAAQREAAIQTLAASASLRTQRGLLGRLRREVGVGAAEIAGLAGLEPSSSRQTVYDNQHNGRSFLPGVRARGDDDAPVQDAAVNDAFDATWATYDFYHAIFERDSLDAAGMELVSTVHYGVDFDNAFWNGAQMVYGDGSGRVFQVGGLTRSIDVVAHELTHGVTDFTAGLVYSKQSGALNEHMSDVFGSLVKQHSAGQTADKADWLIGADTLVPALGRALRSMSEPGTAYSGDRQPGHMDDYVDLPDDNDPRNDNGGVHINSGIPNRAFYLLAVNLGGFAWEKAGRIWYRALTERLQPDTVFSEAAELTLAVADELYGPDERAAVENAWQEVGVLS
ncbi:MAG: M4 family metallopeptidase [Actinomycetota bacterium]|nr:M4 family metallopeptidase [Actinomycetota bacterium]